MLQGTDNGHPTSRTAVFTPATTSTHTRRREHQRQGLARVYGVGQNLGVLGETVGGGTGVIGNGGSSNGVGVLGNGGTTHGIGVAGSGVGTGDGVAGQASNGNGVHGTATTATGVGILAENTAGGTALKVAGTALLTGSATFPGATTFGRSGVLTVAAGKATVTRSGVALTAASLATLQQNVAGVYVRAAVPSVSGSSFTVYLNKAVPAGTKVAWFVVN
jgi:hypothetical protein